jgi:hypothetical protein
LENEGKKGEIMNTVTKTTLSLGCLVASVFAVSKGYALFSDVVTAQDNKFYAGIYDIQMSTTDVDNNNIAEANLANWTDTVIGAWKTGLQWTPGSTVNSRVFIRNRGDIDTESLFWHLSGRSFYGSNQLDQAINLTKAWYDRNANGIEETGEDLMPALTAAYNPNGGNFTLRELFDGTDLVHGGVAFNLESGTAVLPGIKTSPTIGGYTGSGKGLFLNWQFDPNVGAMYQDAWVELDFVFTGEQKG